MLCDAASCCVVLCESVLVEVDAVVVLTTGVTTTTCDRKEGVSTREWRQRTQNVWDNTTRVMQHGPHATQHDATIDKARTH
jgi:hypothetical protein